MIENSEVTAIPRDNIQSLLTLLVAEIDRRFSHFRRGTRYENVRPSDVRVFVAATRGRRTVSEIAQVLNVTRQAVHASVQRLAKLKIVELQPIPGNKRDKHVTLTERGLHAQKAGVDQTLKLESEFAALIGTEALEGLRQSLTKLVAGTRQRNTEDGETGGGVAEPIEIP